MVSALWWALALACLTWPASRFRGPHLSIYLLAVSVRTLSVAASATLNLNPFNEGDATYFENTALAKAEGVPVADLLFTTDWLEFGNRWITLLALLFGAGANATHIALINAAIASAAIAALRPRSPSNRWIWFAIALSPFAVGLQGSLLREAPVFATATVASLYLLDRRVNYPTALAAATASAAFHPGMVPILVVTAAAAIGDKRTASSNPQMLTGKFMVAAILAIVGITSTGFGLERLGNQELQSSVIASRFQLGSRGRLGYDLPSPVGLSIEGIAYFPVRIAYFITGPLPGYISNAADVMAFTEGLIFFACFVAVLRQLIRRKGKAPIVALAFVGSLLIFSIAVGNFGTALRHRHKLVPPAVVTAISLGMLSEQPATTSPLDQARRKTI